jgi:hypothetical protein
MRDQRINADASGNGASVRRCSRCGDEKPTDEFYRNPATVCKPCQRQAARASRDVRRAAITRLVRAHPEEYRRLLAAERAGRTAKALGGEAA